MLALTKAALLSGLLLTPTLALAASHPVSAANSQNPPSIKLLAQRLFPQSQIDAIEPTPIPGVYEIRAGQSLLYMDTTGRYVIIGELYDFTTKKNLTAQRMASVSTLKFSTLPLDLAIHLGPKNATRHVVVFDDVDCPFCRKFHEETLPGLLKDGVAVHVFLYPLTSLHPQAEAKSRAIWCSADRAAALDAVLRDMPIESPSASCTTPLQTIRELAGRLNVTGTPVIILDNNERIDGFVDHQTLTARWKTPERR